eukprot:m.169194 g.169194  ORF g.169194 m.169194 type:complete len:177 (+) comp24156_c0_seq3:1028-1558(+)
MWRGVTISTCAARSAARHLTSASCRRLVAYVSVAIRVNVSSDPPAAGRASSSASACATTSPSRSRRPTSNLRFRRAYSSVAIASTHILAWRREREKSPSLTQDWHRTRDAVWPQQGHRIADTAISTIPGRATWFQSDLSDMCCQEYNNGDNTDTHLPLTQHLSLNPLSGLAAPSQV